MVPGLLPPHRLHHLAARLGVAVGVLLVPDRQRHPRVTLDVLELLAVYFGIDHEALAVGTYPNVIVLQVAAGQHRGDHPEVWAARQLHRGRVQLGTILGGSHALYTSFFGVRVPVLALYPQANLLASRHKKRRTPVGIRLLFRAKAKARCWLALLTASG